MNSNFASRWGSRWGPCGGLFALVLISALIVTLLTRYANLSGWMRHTHQVIAQIDLVQTRVERVENAARGYLLTRDPSFRRYFEASREEIPAMIDALHRLTDDNLRQVERGERLRETVQVHLNQLARFIARAPPRTGPFTVKSLESLRDVRTIIDAMLGEEKSLLSARTSGADQFAAEASLLMIVGMITAASLFVYGYVASNRIIRANRAQAGLLQQIFESIGDGLLVSDMHGNLTHHNRNAGHVLNVDLGRARTVGEMGALVNMPAENSPTRRALRGEIVKDHEFKLTRNGTERTLSIDSRPVVGAHGRMIGALAVLRDVTERRNLEDEWKRARESAVEASRLKSDFLATMSHEIRTPMNGVVGMSTILLHTALDDEQRSYVKTIKSSADSLLALINQVLDHARIESGKLQLCAVDFNVIEMLDGVLDLFRYLARSKALDLRLDLAPDVPAALHGDADRLRQVIINLVGNAMKFTEQGFVEVTVRNRAAEGGHRRLEFNVRDTGRGMSPAAQERLFQKFSQVHDRRTNAGGSGLGLMISRELVQAMGGEISCESAENFGSRFTFTVLMAEATADPAGPNTPSMPRRKLSGRVLVAEDQPVNQLVIRKYLEQLGVRHEVVADGEACLRRLAVEKFDLVLMDCQMRPMDGYQATARIRMNEATLRPNQPKLPVVALTAEGMSGDRRRCFEVGMDAFLSKPIALENLYAMLKKYLPDATSEAPTERPGDHDRDAITRLDGFESDGRPLIAVLFEEFRDNGRLDVDKLVAAEANQRWDDLRHLAHSLKSSGRTLGLMRFGDVCEQIERDGNGGRPLTEEVLEVRALFERGCQWLDHQLKSAIASATT